jgi:hypothetical protein
MFAMQPAVIPFPLNFKFFVLLTIISILIIKLVYFVLVNLSRWTPRWALRRGRNFPYNSMEGSEMATFEA